MVERLFLAVPRGCLQFVIVVFPDHTHLSFLLLLVIVFCCKVLVYNSCKLNGKLIKSYKIDNLPF